MADDKSILYIIFDLKRGGAQGMLYNLSAIAKLNKFNVNILYFAKNDEMYKDFKEIQIPTYLFYKKRFIMQFIAFRKLIKKISPDIVHLHTGLGGLGLVLFIRLCGFKKILHTVHILSGLKHTLRTGMFEFFSQFFIHKFVHVSENSQKRHQSKYLVNKRKSLLIYNGINYQKIRNKIRKNNEQYTKKSGFHITTIANLSEVKGHIYALKAIQKLVVRHNQVYYHIVGAPRKNDNTHSTIDAYIKENKLESNIICHGTQEDVYPFLLRSDLYLCTSEDELLPMSILEAMACHVPIVATRVGGIPELLGRSNEFGLLAKPKDFEDIFYQIFRMYSDKALRSYYTEQSKKRAMDFNFDNTLCKYIDLYNDLLT